MPGRRQKCRQWSSIEALTNNHDSIERPTRDSARASQSTMRHAGRSTSHRAPVQPAETRPAAFAVSASSAAAARAEPAAATLTDAPRVPLSVAKAVQPTMLTKSPERALALVRQSERRFADGYFRRFAQRYPALPYGVRIQRALEAADPTAAPSQAAGS